MGDLHGSEPLDTDSLTDACGEPAIALADAHDEAETDGSRAAVEGFAAAVEGVIQALTGATRALKGALRAE